MASDGNVLDAEFQQMIKKVNRYLWDFYNLHSIIISIAGFGNYVGQILYANRWAHRLLKYPPGSLIGRNITILMSNSDDVVNHDSYLREYLNKDRLGMVLNEGRVVDAKDADGGILPTYLSVIEKDIDGMRVFIGFMTDLSQQTKAMERAQAAAATRAGFLACMSHEIRTPLNSIIGRADLLRHMSLSPEVLGHVDSIIYAGENLLRIINDVLDFSKIDAGKLVMERMCFDLHKMIDKVIDVMKTTADKKHLLLSVKKAPDLPDLVIGDPTKLHQVLINLIGNAIKFTDEGEITCAVVVEGKTGDEVTLKFSVMDTGIGIPKAKLDSIFVPFAQADSSTTRKFGGTGLGLSITREIVEMHHGNIWVESIVGKGSIFYFTMMFELSYECRLDEETAVEKEVRDTTTHRKILIVEDNEENIKLALLFLKDTKYEADVARNGSIGVEMFKAKTYDIVFMDVEMPVMDGWTAVEQIRKWEKENSRKETTIIMLTAHSQEEHRKKAFDIGANDFITKPTKKKILIDAINRFTMDMPEETREVPSTDNSTGDGIAVEIDGSLEYLIPDYLNTIKGYIDTLGKAMAATDYEQLRQTGHSLKGSGRSYGFDFISEVGKNIEQFAVDKNVEGIKLWTEKLESYLKRLNITFVNK
ncbi:MAG: ATP-binding protein [Candidatus Magnetobacterium sp. LHC-1]